MSARLKINAVLSLLLTALLYKFFMFTKHDPLVSPLIPFGDDPYDAIGSFSLILSILLAIRSAFRAFRPYRSGASSPLSLLFLARTEIAIPTGVLITLAADVIAMTRHPGQWMQKPPTVKLLILMTGMALLSFGLVYLFRRAANPASSGTRPTRRKALVRATIAAATLALFPESLVQSAGLHFLTILFSFLLIAATQSALTVALLPNDPSALSVAPIVESVAGRRRGWVPWAWITAFGLLLGASIFASELGEGSGVPTSRMWLLAALFIGSGTGLMVITFAFFREPLGLFSKINNQTPPSPLSSAPLS